MWHCARRSGLSGLVCVCTGEPGGRKTQHVYFRNVIHFICVIKRGISLKNRGFRRILVSGARASAGRK